jgi:hypothetical protein
VSADLGDWWTDLSAAALVGTSRRHVPTLPAALGTGRVDAAREVALLDAAALGSALRRAGVRTREPEPADPAQDDAGTLPPDRAIHLLELLLHQSPVGPTLMPALVQLWLEAAGEGGHRAPHHLLPELLELATRQERLRSGVRRVADARGAWLARANPEWRWATGAATPATAVEVDAEDWARLPTDRRVAEVERLRATDPAAARALVESTWSTDAAGDRAGLLTALRPGLEPDDEPLLEQALDDRSQKVRDVAVPLLDALPGSARAARMAERLRPLLQAKGVLRKTLEVELPEDPDAAGVRDGLTRPKRIGSVRGWWLQRLAAGAPLEVWTDVTGADPEATWRMLTERDAKVGIVEAVLARGDAAWADALVADVWHPGLLALLSTDRLEAAATRQLGVAATTEQLIAVVSAVPGPWGPTFSRAVLKRLAADQDPMVMVLVSRLTAQLAAGLDPSVRPALEKWMAGLLPGPRERVARISQYLALVPEIPEAFT